MKGREGNRDGRYGKKKVLEKIKRNAEGREVVSLSNPNQKNKDNFLAQEEMEERSQKSEHTHARNTEAGR